MPLHESGEMYLETILILSQKNEIVRGIDIGEYMGYSKPSVSRALRLLKEDGYVTVDEKGSIVLTELGKQTAGKTYERHRILSCFFEMLGVTPQTADEDACRVEHILSEETFAAIKCRVENEKKGAFL